MRVFNVLAIVASLAFLEMHTGIAQTADSLDQTRAKAERGDREAQFNLGSAYDTGKEVPKDDAEAVAWFRKAAEQGLSGAQFNLGVAYATGRGVPQDDTKAVAWYQKAADQGLITAQSAFALSLAYATGKGVPKDNTQAYMWANLAAALENEEAVKLKAIVTEWMSPTQIIEGQRLLQEWITAHQKTIN